MDKQVIYTAIVGSRLHGLETDNSDTDVRKIVRSSLVDLISPFKSLISQDDTWELTRFVSLLVKGNATVHEVMHSTNSTPCAQSIILKEQIYPLCFDYEKILAAHIGYAQSARSRSRQYWSGLTSETRCKSIAAAFRVLAQGRQLLETGTFYPKVKDYSQELHDKLMFIKTSKIDSLDVEKYYDEIENEIESLRKLFDSLPEPKRNTTIDIPKIEKLILEIYNNK